MLTTQDKKEIRQIVSEEIDKKFDQKFDQKFNERFGPAFDKAFDRKFPDAFAAAFNQVVGPSISQLIEKMDRLEEMSQAHSADIMRMEDKLNICIDHLGIHDDKIKEHHKRISLCERQLDLAVA